MPRHSIVLQVFVASPSDVPEERATLDTVVEELNRTWLNSLGVIFEVIKWETHVRPGFNQDPQSVINSQIPSDYDVFIGIFWSRLGTATERALSGSVEEFERAFARYKSSGTAPEIMIYFKDAAIAPSKLDGAQVTALQEFKSSLSERGGLFSIFEDLQGFEASLRAHLSAIANKFANGASGKQPIGPQKLDAHLEIATSDDVEFGLLDYLEIYDSRTSDMVAAMEVINEATIRIGEQLADRSREMNSAQSDQQLVRRFIKRASTDMFHYAETMSSQISVLSTARQDAFSALSSAVALMTDFSVDANQLILLKTALSNTIASVSGARDGVTAMRNANALLPRISKDLNTAKRAVTRNLDNFLSEIDSTESTVINLLKAINRLLDASSAIPKQ